MINIIYKSSEIVELTEKLNNKGMLKKDIANELNMPASAFSSLVKTVLPAIQKIKTNDSKMKERIDEAFELSNNLSKNKIVSKLNEYIELLTNILNNPIDIKSQKDYFDLLRVQSEMSFETIKRHYLGVYDCYYLSSNYNKLKREPLLLTLNQNRMISVVKGNDNSHRKYFGSALITNNHTLTLMISDDNDSPMENLVYNLSIPSTRECNYLRGIFSTTTYAHQPISRKVVLIKRNDINNITDFGNIETEYYNNIEECETKEIYNYLIARGAKTECLHIPNPTSAIEDLNMEIEIEKLIKT